MEQPKYKNGKFTGGLKVVKEGGVYVRIPKCADKFAIGNAAGYYFMVDGQWYFGTRPEHYCIDVCIAHARDIMKYIKDGKIYDV